MHKSADVVVVAPGLLQAVVGTAHLVPLLKSGVVVHTD